MKTRAFAVALALVAAGCELLTEGDEPQGTIFTSVESLNGTFRYFAWDENGRPAVAGYIMLTVAADSTITGTWDLSYLPAHDTTVYLGPQDGTGTLVGHVLVERSKTPVVWYANLNPDMADNNVIITTDRWVFSGFPGVLGEGRLALERLD